MKLFRDVGLVEPDDRHRPRFVGDRRPRDLHVLATREDLLDVVDLGADCGAHPRLDAHDGRDCREVLVAPRKIEE